MTRYSNKPVHEGKLRYGIETIITGMLKLLLLFLASYYLGVMKEMSIIFMTFVSLRFLSGGSHLSTFSRCLLTGSFIFVLASLITKFLTNFLSIKVTYVIFVISILIAIWMLYHFSPNSGGYRKISTEKRIKLKRYSFYWLTLWGIANMSAFFLQVQQNYILATIFGLLLQLWSIHPCTFRQLQKWDKYLNRLKGGDF